MFFDKILLKNIDKEIPIVVSIINTSAKNSPSTTKTNSFSAQTKESELLQTLKNQICSLKSEITFLRERLKEKDYVIRTLLNMKCRFIHDSTSTSCNNLPSAISPRKKWNWNKGYPCREYTKENNYRTKKCLSWVR